MKTLKKITRSTFFLICLLTFFISSMGCSGSDDDIVNSCENWSEQFVSEGNAYSDASQAYSNNPTLINCQNYKAAGLKYINALEGAVKCVPTANTKAFSESLDEYRAEVNAIACQ